MAIRNRPRARRMSRRRWVGRRIGMLEILEERALLSGSPTVYTVTDVGDSAADSGSLRHAIAQANADINPAGSRIRFDPAVFSAPQTISLSGTLELSGTAGIEEIDGPGAGLLTISGNHAVRVFLIDIGVTAAISGLTVFGGKETSGGGISSSGTLSIADSTFTDNSAVGSSGGGASGGAISSSGTLSIADSTFTGNAAVGGSGGGDAQGGGINSTGTLSISGSTFSGNSAVGNTVHLIDTSLLGGAGRGGGISSTGTLSISGSAFSANSATGGSSGGMFGSGNTGSGGGISSTGPLSIVDSTFSGNSATGAGGFFSSAGWGGGISSSGTLSIARSTFSGNSAHGAGGRHGAYGWGGGISSTGRTLSIADSTFTNNSATGGEGFDGGYGQGGGISSTGTISITDSTFSGNAAIGGVGGFGGVGSGGGIYSTGTLSIADSTFSANSASGRSGGVGIYDYEASGGGISSSGTLSIADSTFSANSADRGGGIAIFGGGNPEAVSIDSIFQNGTGGDVFEFSVGLFRSLGHNLFSDSPDINLDPTDLINTDPLLGPLASNGGPTQTMALLPGSPAIDAGVSRPGVTTDQRGIPRPHGGAPDIGAFESRGFTLTIAAGNNQVATPGSAFLTLLAVIVASPFGEPVAGGRVSFTAPTTGASAGLAGNPATIDASGRASVSASANGVVGNYTISAGVAGAPGVAFTLANVVPPPTVVGLQSSISSQNPSILTLSFSQPMDAARAHDPANYRLIWAGRDDRLGTVDDRIIPIRSARYDAASWSVRLRLRHRQPTDRTLWLTVAGASPGGLTNTDGTPLAGAGTGGAPAMRLDLKALRTPMRMGLLPDGGFETPKIHAARKARTLPASDPNLAPWRILSGSVNVQTYWPAAEGRHTLDLDGVSSGTIEQSFATTPGQVYQLVFDYANNPDARTGPAGARLTVTGAGTLLSRDIAHTGSTARHMKYTRFFGTFGANSAMTTLRLTSTTPGTHGIVLDAVSVTVIPVASETTLP